MDRKIKVGYFRGVNFSSAIGVTDWRVALYFNKTMYETWVFGRRETIQKSEFHGIYVVAPKLKLIPFITMLILSFYYAIQARKLKFDVILCNPGMTLGGLLVKLLYPSTKMILDVRSIPVETRGLVGTLSHWYRDIAFRLKFYDAVTVITEGMLNQLDQRYHFKERCPTAVWESGYDDAVFQPVSIPLDIAALEPVRGKFIIMFHGSLSPTRGLDQMIQALHLLKQRGVQDIALVLIGSGAAERDLGSLTNKLGLDDQVLFLQPMQQEELPAYLAHADLGIDLLPDHPWWREQSPLKVYEFLGMGIPVLATDLPCHRNISEAVVIIPDNQPETIADQIETFIRDNSLEGLGPIALEDAKQHTWKARAKILSDFILEEVLEKNIGK